jgi:hypothetical protein
MPLTRLRDEYLVQEGILFLMTDDDGSTVACRVSHEARRDHAGLFSSTYHLQCTSRTQASGSVAFSSRISRLASASASFKGLERIAQDKVRSARRDNDLFDLGQPALDVHDFPANLRPT